DIKTRALQRRTDHCSVIGRVQKQRCILVGGVADDERHTIPGPCRLTKQQNGGDKKQQSARFHKSMKIHDGTTVYERAYSTLASTTEAIPKRLHGSGGSMSQGRGCEMLNPHQTSMASPTLEHPPNQLTCPEAWRLVPLPGRALARAGPEYF